MFNNTPQLFPEPSLFDNNRIPSLFSSTPSEEPQLFSEHNEGCLCEENPLLNQEVDVVLLLEQAQILLEQEGVSSLSKIVESVLDLYIQEL